MSRISNGISLKHTNMSHDAYEWVTSHIWVRRHTSRHTYEWVVSHMHRTYTRVMSPRMRHIIHINESCHTYTDSRLSARRHDAAPIWVSNHTCKRVMSHISTSHATHTNESCHTYPSVLSHISTSQASHISTSHSHIRKSHFAHINESCHTYQRVTAYIHRLKAFGTLGNTAPHTNPCGELPRPC